MRGDRPAPDGDRAARMRFRILLASGGLALGLATLLLPHPAPFEPGLLVAAILLALAISVGLHVRALAGIWDRWGDALGVATVAVAVAATGGSDSVYQDLFLLPLLSAAALRPLRHLAATVTLTALAVLAPVVYEEGMVTGPYLTDLLVDGGTWMLAAGVVAQQARHQRRREADARANEQRFRDLADHAQDGIYRLRLRPDVHFEYVNPAIEEVTGFPPEAFHDDPDLPLRRVHPDDRDLIRRSRTEPQALPDTIEVRWQHPDGHWVWHALREAAVFQGGELAAIQGIVRDVTDQKRREEELELDLAREQEAVEDLRQLDVSRTITLRAVAHDLRSPLMSIAGFAQVLHARDQLTPDEVEQVVGRIGAAARRLERILNAVLELELLSDVHAALAREPVELEPLVRTVVSELDAADHAVEVAVPPASRVTGDAAKLERAVENLLRNAVRHTPPGSTVRVAVERDGDATRLVVEDDGPGVPDELKDEIFAPFRRGTATVEGTGVGLSLVRAIAELHGGRAWVEDAEQRGARFVVSLPPG